MSVQTLPVTRAPAGFDAFFGEHHARLVRACLVLTGDPAEAEDLAQEAMARALERWDRVSTMDDPEGYVYRTAINLHRNAVRRLARAARRRITPAPTDEAEAADRRLDLLRAIRSLPPTQREALALVEWLGYTAEEAGAVLGIDAASVRGRLHRARRTLRERCGGPDG
ncbi:MAG: RNA polymerase subunit sigma-24 [Actinomycetota bacterium]|nr:MAG: RNA polymerase subunit sigma-24 [Actinomycetota bacterium]